MFPEQKILSGRLFERSMRENILNLEEFFKLAMMNGFNAVELRDSQILPEAGEQQIEEVLSLAEKYALPVAMLTARTGKLNDEEGLRRFEDYLQLAVRLKCSQIKVSGGDAGLLRRAADAAAECGVKIGVNNHIGTIWETPAGTMRMLETVGHRNFYCHFDPSHWWLNRVEWGMAELEKLLPYISYYILQDYTEDADFPIIGGRHVEMCSVMKSGQVGYPSISTMLKQLGYRGPAALVCVRGVSRDELRLKQYFNMFF